MGQGTNQAANTIKTMNARQLHTYFCMLRARVSGFAGYAAALERILRDELAPTITR